MSKLILAGFAVAVITAGALVAGNLAADDSTYQTTTVTYSGTLSLGPTPDDTWRYDFNADGAVNTTDLALFAQHFSQSYPTPGPCHAFTSFATPVVLQDGTTLDGVFADDSLDLPSRDYLTC